MPPDQEKTRVDMREKRRLQRILEGTSSTTGLASSLAASFPGRNECTGTHCSLIEQEKKEDKSAREIEVKGKIEEKTWC